MEWITLDDLKGHIEEYGDRSYDSIVYEDEEGFLNISCSYAYAVEHSTLGGMFIVVQAPPVNSKGEG